MIPFHWSRPPESSRDALAPWGAGPCARLVVGGVLVIGAVAGCGTDDVGARSAGSTDDAVAASGTAGTVADPAASGTPADAATDPVRVLFLGTSLTAGLGLSLPEERFTAHLQRFADSAGIPAVMENAGVSGETSAGGLRRLDWALRDPVDVLVVELGANDGLRGQPPAAMEENLRRIVEDARTRHPGVSIVLAGMEAPPNLGEEYTRRFRDVFRDLAREEDLVLVPFLLEGVAGSPDLNQVDGIHPNPEGHRAIARTVWPFLEPLLRDAATRGAGGDGVPESGG